MVRDVGEDQFPEASILLVDDHLPDLLALRAVLEPLKHPLVLAESAGIALRLAASTAFAVILSDVRMPGMDGFALVSQLRAQEIATYTPVILMTAGDTDRESTRRAYALGAVDYLVKPVDPDLLRWRVGALVSLYRRGEELKRRAHLIVEKTRETAIANEVAGRAVAVAEEAERLVQRKDTFVSVLGHDLRTPLSALMPCCQRLARAKDFPDHHKGTVARMLRAAERMNKMITDILDFARSASGASFPIRPRLVSLVEPVTAVVEELRTANPNRPIELVLGPSLVAECDPDRVAQALGNLLTNAIKHAQGAVTVTVDGEGDDITMKVHNVGSPITPEAKVSLFDTTRRESRQSDGLGLGLYIVSGIISAHGGTVTVESSPSEGTTFEARWPKAGLLRAAPPPAEPMSTADDTPLGLGASPDAST